MRKVYILLIVVVIIILFINYYDKYDIDKNTYKDKLITFINENLNDNSKKLLFLPHTELGDEIIMNGAVRYFCTIYNKVVLICKDQYYDQVIFMYKNLNNLLIYNLKNTDSELYYPFSNVNVNRFLPIDDDINQLFKQYNIEFIPMYFFRQAYNIAPYNIRSIYPTHFYDELNIDPEIRYSYFKIYRDTERENELYNKLINIIGNKYIIIIDDEKRNMIIDSNKFTNSIPIFKIGNNSTNHNTELNSIIDKYVFNYIKILENAYEIHTIPSSIMLLLDQLNIKPKVYLYQSLRPDNIYLKNSINWTII